MSVSLLVGAALSWRAFAQAGCRKLVLNGERQLPNAIAGAASLMTRSYRIKRSPSLRPVNSTLVYDKPADDPSSRRTPLRRAQ